MISNRKQRKQSPLYRDLLFGADDDTIGSMFKHLVEDDSPMVRRAAAKTLGVSTEQRSRDEGLPTGWVISLTPVTF